MVFLAAGMMFPLHGFAVAEAASFSRVRGRRAECAEQSQPSKRRCFREVEQISTSDSACAALPCDFG